MRQLLPILAFAWIVPGGGHFLLKRNGRGALLGGAVALAFLAGILMRGPLYLWTWTGADVLANLIHRGGFFAQLLSGLPYFFTVWFGYEQPDVTGLRHDYGAKLLVLAGLLNVLTMVDAYEIARGDKS
jgi:hypothetical protein